MPNGTVVRESPPLWITSVRSATLSLRKKTASCTSDETSRTARLRLTALTPSLDRTVEGPRVHGSARDRPLHGRGCGHDLGSGRCRGVLRSLNLSICVSTQLEPPSPSAVSQHLAKLRFAGLVRVRREGTFAYYAAANTHVQRLLDEALSHADHAVHRVDSQSPHRHRDRA